MGKATIPKQFKELRIQDMEIGAICYTSTYALFESIWGGVYLQGEFTVSPASEGRLLCGLKLTRIGKHEYTVVIPKIIGRMWDDTERHLFGSPYHVVDIQVE